MSARRQSLLDLGEFLRNRRERIKPAHVGLPAGPRRRAPGLRREEVAVLAGLSPTWYTYLEQGRDIRVSPEVLESLARVLLLDEDERRYLYLLAHGRNPPVSASETAIIADAAVVRAMTAVQGADRPVYIGNQYGDVIAWNDAATTWYTDFARLPDARRNMLWWLFADPVARERLVNWTDDAKDVVARFRLASVTRPRDPRFKELIEATWETSGDFRRWWSAHEVTDTYPRVRGLRSADGRTQEFEVVVLRMVDGFHSVVLHTPTQAA